MSKIVEGIAKDLKSIPEKLKAKTGNVDKKKLLLMNLPLLWSSIFVTLVAKKYHESVTLPSGLRMVYDNH